ncbi:MAG: serine dehydratase beta chain, partial [Actinomycetales bacterium]
MGVLVNVGVFDLFRVGVGPSSSHTVGPMRAAAAFVQTLDDRGQIRAVESIEVELFGSLAATGRGHATLTAILLGLQGLQPQTLTPEVVQASLERIDATGCV